MTHGFLTTHVLDTARGVPASDLLISLYALTADARRHICDMTTNSDGRTDSPILAQQDFAVGQYLLIFHAGAYLDRHFPNLPQPKFIDVIPLQFAIADADAHYHVPLLLSPFGYSTYRGS